MKHREVNDERARSFIREQRLRQQAQRHFREMQKRNYSSADDWIVSFIIFLLHKTEYK